MTGIDASEELAKVERLVIAGKPRIAGFTAPQPTPIAGHPHEIIPLPPTPKQGAAMMNAHRANDMKVSLGHAIERMQAATRSKDPAVKSYEAIHIANHLNRALAGGKLMADNLRRNYPAEGKELDKVCETLGLATALSPTIKAATTAHLLQTTMNECTHAVRHALLMRKAEPADQWAFNAAHSSKHLLSAHEHACKLKKHLSDNYPAEAKLLDELDALMEHEGEGYVKASAPDLPKMSSAQANYRPADVDGQTCHTCSNRDGSACALVAIVTSPKNVCDSYQGEAELAAPAAWPSGQKYAKSFLSPPRDMPSNATTISAPGAGNPEEYAYGMLKQAPAQTVSPSPPLPPEVDLPSDKEMLRFAVQLGKMADDQDHHLRGAQLHMESAAAKMSNNPVSALYSLRSAQMAIQDAWRERVQQGQPRIAYVFSANTPPAEQSSQQQAWAAEQKRIGEMQDAASTIAGMVDRVRRAYFRHAGMEPQTSGGGLAGQPTARLTEESGLDRVLRLATVNVKGYNRFENGREQTVSPHTEVREGGWIPQDDWAKGQADWAARGEAAWRAKAAASDAERRAGAHAAWEKIQAHHGGTGTPQPHEGDIAEHMRTAHGVNLGDRRVGEAPFSPQELMRRHDYIHSSGSTSSHTHAPRTAYRGPLTPAEEAREFQAQALSMRPEDYAKVKRGINSWGLPAQEWEQKGEAAWEGRGEKLWEQRGEAARARQALRKVAGA